MTPALGVRSTSEAAPAPYRRAEPVQPTQVSGTHDERAGEPAVAQIVVPDQAPTRDGRRQPVRPAVVVIELAALVLPRRYRMRYDHEFLAELYEMSPREQMRYAVDVLAHSWRLSSVLRQRPPTHDEDDGSEG